MKYAELRRMLEHAEWERDDALAALRRQREVSALRIAGLQHQIEQLCDPIVRAKMLEPMPPIYLKLPPSAPETDLVRAAFDFLGGR